MSFQSALPSLWASSRSNEIICGRSLVKTLQLAPRISLNTRRFEPVKSVKYTPWEALRDIGLELSRGPCS